MRFSTLVTLSAALLLGATSSGAAGIAYCGVTTDIHTQTKYTNTYAPTVTSTRTVNQAVCHTTETVTETDTKRVQTTTTETSTITPTITSTYFLPTATVTTTRTTTLTTCGPTANSVKRSLPALAGDDGEEDVQEELVITNGERLRRGLPLNVPHKRAATHVAQPSCVPSQVQSYTHVTDTKTVTPTQWSTTSHCATTKTAEDVVHTQVTETDTRTRTVTRTAQPTTSVTNVQLTHTSTATARITSYTGACATY